MNIEETYRALIEAIAAYVMAVARDAVSGATKDSPGAKEDMIAAIRAHGAARELKGHVGACGRKTGERSDTDSTNHINRALLCCGDGPDSGRGRSWYCDDGREIEELR